MLCECCVDQLLILWIGNTKLTRTRSIQSKYLQKCSGLMHLRDENRLHNEEIALTKGDNRFND